MRSDGVGGRAFLGGIGGAIWIQGRLIHYFRLEHEVRACIYYHPSVK